MQLGNTPAYELGHNGLSPRGERFISFVQDYTHFSEEEYSDIIKACQKIESDKYPERKTGEDYVTHLYEVTELYITLFGKNISKERVIACLLHDAIEDIEDDSLESISDDFGGETGFYVSILSKTDNPDKGERNTEYNERFESLEQLCSYIRFKYYDVYKKTLPKKRAMKIARMAVAIKICDRIHNLSTMPMSHFREAQVRKKIDETNTYFLSVARRLGGAHSKLYTELKRAICFAETRIIRYNVANKV